MRPFSQLSLRTKLIVTSLVISIVPLTIIGGIANHATHDALVNAANQSLAGAAAQTAANVDGFIQANLDAVRTEAQLPDLAEFLALFSRQSADRAGLGSGAARTAAVLRALSRRDQLYILSYALLDENGIDVIDTNNSNVGIDYSNREYFRRPVATGLPYASPVEFSTTGNPPSLYFSAPIRNAQGEIVGVLRVRYNATILQQMIAHTNGLAGADSSGVLVDENHLRLADGATPDLVFTTVVPFDPARVAQLQAAQRLPRQPIDQLSTNLPDFEQGLTNSATSRFFRAPMHNSETMSDEVAVAALTSEPWLVAFGQPETVFLAPVSTILARDSLLVGAVMILLVTLSVAGGARLLTGPILRLTATAQQVGAGDLRAQARVETQDEIGKLAQTFNAMTRQLRQTMDGLAERTAELRFTNERLRAELIERQRGEAALRESEAKYRALVDEVSDGFYVSDLTGNLTFANRALARILGYERPEALIGRSFREFVLPGHADALAERYRAAMSAGKGSEMIATEVVRPDGAKAFVEIKPQVIIQDSRPVGSRGTLRDITERKRAEQEIQRRLAELEAVNHLSTAMRAAQTLEQMLPVVLDITMEVMRAVGGGIWLYDPSHDELRPAVTRGWGEQPGVSSIPPEKPGEGIAGYAFATRQPCVAREYRLDLRLSEPVRQRIPPGIGGAAIPIRAGDSVIGAFDINVRLPRELTPEEAHLLTILGEIAGNAIQRTRLHEQTEQRLQRLSSLHQIDTAINSSLDLQLTLSICVDQVVSQLRVDAAAVILFNARSQTLEYAAGRGFRTPARQRTRQPLGEGTTGRVALERRTLRIPDLRVSGKEYALPAFLSDEEFVAYYGVPLIAKGQVMGVLEVFHRALLASDEEWFAFLEALAGQAAIAIDNGVLFKDLQRSSTDLMLAYDATIEGWSRALDLRDRETEGHTQRVTTMAIELARAMGIRGDELAHIRRGALLHDIGKMGIPDSILHKPDKLTPEEWAIMRKHPEYAYEMLSPIAYLRPALDIPFRHHEKWDGTGYPGKLKGEQIPLSARVFAVVDVWDALRSDRPYREAWSKEKTLEHIRSLVGTHFDPRVVEAFLKLVGEESLGS